MHVNYQQQLFKLLSTLHSIDARIERHDRSIVRQILLHILFDLLERRPGESEKDAQFRLIRFRSHGSFVEWSSSSFDCSPGCHGTAETQRLV